MRVVNDALIDLKSHVYKEIIENPDKEKIVDFNKQQKGGRLKILNPKKKLNDRQQQFAQEKASNTSGNTLNENEQVMYSWY